MAMRIPCERHFLWNATFWTHGGPTMAILPNHEIYPCETHAIPMRNPCENFWEGWRRRWSNAVHLEFTFWMPCSHNKIHHSLPWYAVKQILFDNEAMRNSMVFFCFHAPLLSGCFRSTFFARDNKRKPDILKLQATAFSKINEQFNRIKCSAQFSMQNLNLESKLAQNQIFWTNYWKTILGGLAACAKQLDR